MEIWASGGLLEEMHVARMVIPKREAMSWAVPGERCTVACGTLEAAAKDEEQLTVPVLETDWIAVSPPHDPETRFWIVLKSVPMVPDVVIGLGLAVRPEPVSTPTLVTVPVPAA